MRVNKLCFSPDSCRTEFDKHLPYFVQGEVQFHGHNRKSYFTADGSPIHSVNKYSVSDSMTKYIYLNKDKYEM